MGFWLYQTQNKTFRKEKVKLPLCINTEEGPENLRILHRELSETKVAVKSSPMD